MYVIAFHDQDDEIEVYGPFSTRSDAEKAAEEMAMFYHKVPEEALSRRYGDDEVQAILFDSDQHKEYWQIRLVLPPKTFALTHRE